MSKRDTDFSAFAPLEETPAATDGLTDGISEAVATIAAEAPSTPAPQAPAFVYATETTETSREFIQRMSHLERLISEDNEELRYLDEERGRQTDLLLAKFEQDQRDLQASHAQATAMVEARRHDRERARSAIAKVVDEIRGIVNGQ